MNNYFYYISFLVFGFIFISSSDSHAQCDVNFDDQVYLENQYRKKHYAQIGALTSGESFFKVDDTLSFQLGFKKSVWVAAYGSDDSLKVAANTVVTNGKRDFVGGPILEEGQSQSAFCSFYTRVWHVTSAELAEMSENFIAGTLSEDNIPLDIWEWPAKNNLAIGDFAPSYDIAPFYDNDNDGIYDPLSGDYPIALDDLPFFIPESFAFTVYNDQIEHTSSDVDSLIMEFHQMDYFVNCLDEGPEERSVFTRLKYIYKGDMDLRGLKMGIWKLGHLGCHLDDLVGVDVDLNTTYSYNTLGVDQLNCKAGASPIPDDLGAISTQIFLNNVMDKSMYHHFEVFGNFPVATYSPNKPIHYLNNLSGKWRDGRYTTEGGIAYDTMSTDIVHFTFPEYPGDTTTWSMENVDAPFTNVASVTTLHEKEMVSSGYSGYIDYADHIVFDGVTTGFDIFDIYQEEVNVIKNTYLNILYGNDFCGVSSVSPVVDRKELKIFPNPATQLITIKSDEGIVGDLKIIDYMGKTVYEKELNLRTDQIEIDISQMQSGIYHLVINDGKKINSTSFVKAH